MIPLLEAWYPEVLAQARGARGGVGMAEVKDVKGISPESMRRIRAGAKCMEVVGVDEANAIEATKLYRIDRLSESRNVYVLMRRERA